MLDLTLWLGFILAVGVLSGITLWAVNTFQSVLVSRAQQFLFDTNQAWQHELPSTFAGSAVSKLFVLAVVNFSTVLFLGLFQLAVLLVRGLTAALLPAG